MAKDSKITRKDIADKKVLELGDDYAKSLKPAVEANEKWLKTFEPIIKAAKEYAKLEKQFKISKSRKEFLQLKEKEEKIRAQSIKNVKIEQEAKEKANKALVAANKAKQEEIKIRKTVADATRAEEKIKQELLNTENKSLTVEAKKARAKKRAIKLTAEEKENVRILNRNAREAAKISSKLSTEYEKQAVKLIRLKREYKDVALVEGQTSEKAEKLRKEIQKLDTALKDVDAGVGEYQRNVGNYKSALGGAARAARSLAQEMGALGGAFLVVSVVRDAFNRIREFDKEMQKLAGLSGQTRGELADLEQAIIDVAAASISTSNDIAKLATVLVQMGKSKSDVIALLDPVNKLSLGLDTTAEQAGEFLIQTLNAFGKGAESGQEFADIIAKISNSTALDFQRMVDSFSYLSPVARQLGLSLNDVGAIIGVLNDNGIKAQRAGRLMGTSFQRLASEGLTLEDALDKINEAQENTTNKLEVMSVATDLFMSQSAGLGIVLANNREKMAEYSKSFEDAEGSLKQLTDKQLKSLDAQLKILDSAWEAYILSTNSATGASNALRDAVSFLARNLSSIINTIVYVTGIWVAYKVAVLASSVAMKVTTAVTNALRIAKVALAGGIGKATKALKLFSIASKSTGIGILVGVLGAAVAAFIAFKDGAKDAAAELKKLKEEAKKSRDAIVDLNIAAVKKRLNEIDQIVNGEKEALNKKTEYIKEEIKRRTTGQMTIDEIDKEATKRRLERQKTEQQKQIKLEKLLQEELAKINEGEAPESNVPRAATKSSIPTTQKRIISIEPILNQNASEKTVSELRKLLATLEKEKAQNKKEAEEQLKKEQIQAAKERRELLAKNEYELQKFILEQKILGQNAIAESETASWEERKKAIKERAKFQKELAKLTAVEKLRQTKTFSEAELKHFKEVGILTKDQLKKLTDEELLIYKKFQARKREILGQKERSQDDLEIEQIKENAKIKQLEYEEALNNEIRLENEAFQKKQGIYAKAENAIELHEKRVAKIKERYAKQALNVQVNAIEKLLKNEELSALKRAEYEKELAALKRQISDLTLDDFKENQDKTVEYEKLTTERILDIAGRLANALTSLANSIYEAKIQNINAEIEKNNEKYNRWLESEQLTEKQRKEIEKKRQKEEEQLRKKKQKIKRKQAITDKAMAIVDIGISTAMGIMQAYAQLGPIGGTIAAALIGVIGTIQTAAVIAKPIPKYVKGTSNHPGGPAEVAEERPEVIHEPGKDPYVVRDRSILDLPKGTKVTPSLEEYQRLMRASILTSIDSDNKKLNDFQAKQAFDHNNDKLVNEMRLTREAIKKQKQPIHFHERKIDIDHAIWRSNNIKWD